MITLKKIKCVLQLSGHREQAWLSPVPVILPTELLSRVPASPVRKEACGPRKTITSQSANSSRENNYKLSGSTAASEERKKEHLVQDEQVEVFLGERLFEILACDDKEVSHHPSQ